MNTPFTTSDEAKTLMTNAQSILILPSSPDGDSIGSALALMSVLRKLGKDAIVVSTNEIPDYLQFLPLTHQIQPQLPGGKDFIISLKTDGTEVDHLKYEVEDGRINIIVTPKNGRFTGHDLSFGAPSHDDYDLVITVDTGDLVQLGTLPTEHPELFSDLPLLNIDHHSSNGRFGTHNFLDFNVAATTQLLTRLIQDLERETGLDLIDEDVATLLLVGIVTDTGSFQHSNTSPEAFEVAADLLERGARQQELIKHIFKTKSLATLKLWGRVLSKIKYVDAPRLVFSTITQQDLLDTGATVDDNGGIIDELMSNAPNAEVVLLLKEKEPGFVSGSLRAPGTLADVSEIAGIIGGGGHKKAAGFRIKGKTMDEALEEAQGVIAAYMDKKLHPEKYQGTQEASDQSSGATIAHPDAMTLEEGQKVFPSLKKKHEKPVTSLPKHSAGGEDMLLQDFRKRQATKNPEEERIKDQSAKFFQDKDGQQKIDSSMNVEEVLKRMQKGGTM
jgi:phosphoesterase RecJ-like protein